MKAFMRPLLASAFAAFALATSASAATFTPTVTLSGSAFLPGDSIGVTIKLDGDFDALSVDFVATPSFNGTPVSAQIFVMPPAEVPFTSDAIDTAILDVGFLDPLGPLSMGGTTIIDPSKPATILSTDTLFAFALHLRPDVQGGAYTIAFDFNYGFFDPAADSGVSTGTASALAEFRVAEVPEPSTWALMAAGLLSLGVMLRRRRA
jgi:hypothetical protein